MNKHNFHFSLLNFMLILFSISLWGISPVHAAKDQMLNKDWFVAVGAATLIRSNYQGSEDVEAFVVPYLEVEYKEKVFLDGARGLGAYLYRDGQKRLSASVSYAFGRENDDSPLLNDLEEINGGLVFNAYGRYPLSRYAVADINVAHQFTGSNIGTTATAGISTRLKVTDKLTFFPGGQITYGTAEHNNALFGLGDNVIAGTATAANFSPFEADAGFRSVGARMLTRYEINDHWELVNLITYSQLIGDAADSPIIEQRGNLFSITALSYKF